MYGEMKRVRGEEWWDYTWNPIVGCSKGCRYCWARRLNDRFGFVEKFEEPVFFWDRLKEPRKVKTPAVIFTVSMGDFWDPGVKPGWHREVYKSMREAPQHFFLVLTKQAERMRDSVLEEDALPKNLGIGVTVDTVASVKRLEALMAVKVRGLLTFASFEPMMFNLGLRKYMELSKASHYVDWTIIGGWSGGRKPIPEDWVFRVMNRMKGKIYVKTNIGNWVSFDYKDLPERVARCKRVRKNDMDGMDGMDSMDYRENVVGP